MGDNSINFSAFGGMTGVGSIKGLLATKKLARQLRLKCDELHAKGKYYQDTSVQPPPPEKFEKPKKEYQNTYRLKKEHNEFPSPFSLHKTKMEEYIAECMKNNLGELAEYDAEKCNKAACTIADQVKAKAKELKCDRTRFVTFCVVGQNKRQAVRCTGRCIWDRETDTSFTVHYTHKNIFAYCTVYGVYLE